MKRKLLTVIFWGLLGLGVGSGPYDPKKTEDMARIMNETKIEIVLEKADGPPDSDAMMEIIEVEGQRTAELQNGRKPKRSRRLDRLKNAAGAFGGWFRRGRNQLEPIVRLFMQNIVVQVPAASPARVNWRITIGNGTDET
ncbi:MAG TPA: hypothetical protein VMB47_18565 [Candidatus Aquilonibacter sp.]|nr:hypothetical protein [Candidatus Aquilonibacter sp.]